jgi:murein DD-endopeptidase MepM/ murein hydrolase activator NlpD
MRPFRLTMLSFRRPHPRLVCALLAGMMIVCVGATWLLTRSPTARAASVGQLQQQISAGQGQISSLAGAVGAASNRLGQLNSSIAALQSQIARIQADLNAKRAELLKLRAQLAAARTRLGQLESFEAHAEAVLSKQLVSSYESDRPDLMSVVLESTGFKDLLERLAFAQRIRKQDVRVVSQVRAARRAVAAQATRLGALEARQQVLTAQVLAQRNTLARQRLSVVQQELAVAQLRQVKAGQLANARGQVAALQGQVSKIQAAQAAAAAQASGASSTSSVGAGQVSSGGGFTFPMPKGAASPPGTWTLDQGVDIAAPGGTPLLAVGSGTIVLHGIGGFGPDAPVLHLDSGQYVYYGHAGPGNAVAIGTHVGAGQVISEVGSGIVGISTGPHLEIGYCDSSGTPLGSGTAPQMMSLLQSSYGG